MKKTGLLSLFFLFMMTVSAQHPVSWNFSAKKLNAGSYEIHMTATMQDGWHLYSQDQPEDAIAMPTTFTINNNPLISLNGKIKEIGKMEKYKDSYFR